MSVELAIITNSFNRKSLFEKAAATLLPALERWKQRVIWVVFDAGSNDGSIEWINEMASKRPEVNIRLLKPSSPAASSFAEGCNQSIAYAAAHCPELQWCLFYETDNQFLNPEALDMAVQFLLQHPQIGGTGFTVERLDGSKTGYGCRFPGIMSFAVGQQAAAWLHLDDPPAPQWHQDSAASRWALCDAVFTSPLLIRYQAWREVGPMDAANFPFTDSDLEWCWRAYERGWPMTVLDVPGVIHDNGGSVSNWSGRRVLWFHQSRLRLLQRKLPWRSQVLKVLVLLRHAIEILLLLPRSLRSAQARQSLRTRFILVKGLWNNYEQVLNS